MQHNQKQALSLVDAHCHFEMEPVKLSLHAHSVYKLDAFGQILNDFASYFSLLLFIYYSFGTYYFPLLLFQSTRETSLGETRQTCAAQFPCPRWELPSPAFLPTSPTGCFRWVQTVHPHQHSITHASPYCCSPAPAEPHHGGSTRPGNGVEVKPRVTVSFTHWSRWSCFTNSRVI